MFCVPSISESAEKPTDLSHQDKLLQIFIESKVSCKKISRKSLSNEVHAALQCENILMRSLVDTFSCSYVNEFYKFSLKSSPGQFISWREQTLLTFCALWMCAALWVIFPSHAEVLLDESYMDMLTTSMLGNNETQ